MFITLIVGLLFTLILIILLSKNLKKRNAICKSTKRLDGRTAIVTGGTSGIGLEIAVDFARRGARVIIACPYEDEGINAKKLITEKTGSDKVIFKLLDLSSLSSVRDFANDIIKNEDRLDILVNNAGVGTPGDFLTADGMHFIMQVNYYGHFLLTLLLLELLEKSGSDVEKSRIINMTSMTRALASFNIDNYDKVGYWFDFYHTFQRYATSKLCLVLFSYELTKRLNNVVVNNSDPGLVATRIYKSCNVFIGLFIQFLLNWFFKNPWEGAQTAIHIALDDKAGLICGEIYENCELVKTKKSNDIYVLASKLWERSIKLVQFEATN